ncbi:uncharacterized protein LOC133186634 [Saccostrea echinata]|uniref:uncharacterized protein LOC133186634 n=1 Tax=Saccostrea echinata TaxID=191078 RepID=UPI002A7ED27B|nr:uncharacterized protein LOC133186634 [Saccostrea echinata]
MDTLSGPSGVSLKRLNIKNNLAELYLKKQLDQFQREKTFSISHIDRDRFDTRDFLKQIQKIESDNNHAAITYLGREPNANYKERLAKFRGSIETLPTADTTARVDHDVSKETVQQPPYRPSEIIKPSTVPTVHPKTTLPDPPTKNCTMPEIKISNPSPEMLDAGNETKNEQKTVKRPETLPLLGTSLTNRRGSVYLQIAAVVNTPDDASVSSEEMDSDEEENPQKPKKISSRRKSFMAWINTKKKTFPSLQHVDNRSKDEVRRQSFFSWVESREREKQKATFAILEADEESSDIGELDSRPRVPSVRRCESLNINPFKAKARQIMHTLSFIRKEPLNARLQKFYSKLEEIKKRDEMSMRVLSRNACRSVQEIRSPR